MKKMTLSLVLLFLLAGTAWAQTTNELPGWHAFVIREANDGVTGPPVIQDHETIQPGSIEFAIVASGQKAGLGTDLINGATVGQIATLHIDRLDDVLASGSLYGPYFNVWVTDGLGNYAVIANEPSNAAWAADRWDVPSWAFLSDKTAKVYEVPGWNTGTSWVHTHALANGWDGVLTNLDFVHVADLVIAPPPAAYITNPANAVGSGAPDEYGTNVAYGYNWIFGDTASNYISGGDGFVVNNYFATAPLAVQNVTQGTSYATIEAALAAANAYDTITIDDGTYNPPSTLNIAVPLTLSGQSEAGVIINIPAAGGYGMTPTADDITLQNFTLVANAANENYPIHASGTSNAPTGFVNLTISNVTVSGSHRRACFDIHGYSNVVLADLTARDSWGGNGIQLTGVAGATVSGVTTADNAWGSLAVYCSKAIYLNRGSSDVVIDGSTCSFGEGTVFTQDEFGLFNTNISVTGYDYNVRNLNFRADAAGFTYFLDTEADAVAFALGLDSIAPGSWITAIAGGTHIVADGMSLRFAIENALGGDEIQVRTGTYLETGQLVIDKDLDIVGDAGTRPVVMTDTSTGNSGDARGWFLQSAGTHLELRNLELDGSGVDVYQMLRSTGSGVVDNCAIRNITFPGYAGVAIAAFGAGNWDVTNNTFDNIGRVGFLAFGAGLDASSFSGNTYTGKGPGDWLDYAADISAGAVLTVDGNTITACQGVASTDGSTSAGLLVTTYFGAGTTATLTNNTLTGNTTGVAVGYDAADASAVTGSDNDISGNDSYGVTNTGAAAVDFTGNWWGSFTGPYHPTLNPGGLGNEVGDNVLFDPWTGMAVAEAVLSDAGPINCTETVSVTFNYVPDANTPDLFLYDATVSVTGELAFGAISGQQAVFNGTGYTYTTDNVDGSKTITAATLATGGDVYEAANGPVALFTIEFVPVVDGIATVTVDNLVLRDPANVTIPVNLPSATIEVDCTAPAGVTGIAAATGHEKVDVTWTHDGTDAAVYRVYRGLWHDGTVGTSAYPEYDDVAPATPAVRPASPAVANLDPEWDWVGTVGVGTTTYTDVFTGGVAERGVYTYEVFVIDAAGNVSPAAPANDRATNYWLGDVAVDGQVGIPDFTLLGAAFGTSEAGGGAYSNIIDVGPTDDWSRLGIPTTDSAINFEDLMIFSLNFGVVSAAKSLPVVSKTVELEWVAYDNGDYGLRLVAGSGVKGLRVRADVPVQAVDTGLLLDEQSELTFLQNVGEKLDTSVAVMGVNTPFSGTGDLFVVRGAAGIAPEDLHITARSVLNKDMEVKLTQGSGTLTPRVFSLKANYPNPFNPMTKISFSLPTPQDVRLAVYSLDGRKVATLLNEARGPGLHEVVWAGRNDDGHLVASGVYLYRLEAGPYSQVRKMTLMK